MYFGDSPITITRRMRVYTDNFIHLVGYANYYEELVFIIINSEFYMDSPEYYTL